MRLILILYALQGAALAQEPQTHTKEFCETSMSRTPVVHAPRVTISTKIKLTARKPYCKRKHKHETITISQGTVTSTVFTRSIFTVSVTAPQKLKTLTITKTLTETAVTTPTFYKTDTAVTTTTSTLTSTITVPTVSGFVPIVSVSGFVPRQRSLSKRDLPRRNAWEDIMRVLPSRVFPRKLKPKDKPKYLDDPCTIKIEPGDKNHPVQPTQSRGMVACYKSVQITKTVLFKSCIAWTKTITLDQKTVVKHEVTGGWVTSTVTEADTTMTADDTVTTTSTLTKETRTDLTVEFETVTRTDLAPAESSWAACNAENLINAANGGHGINAVNIGKNIYNVLPLVNPYDCCVECQKRPNCIFSVAYHHKCYLIIGTACLPSHTFDTSFTTLKKLLPENGPTLSNGHCGHIRNAGDAG